MVKLKGISLMLLCTIFTALGQFFLKKGTNLIIPTNLFTLINYPLFLGIFLYAAGAFLMIFALKFGELNVLYPIVSLTFIWVTVLSATFLNETTSTNKIAGIGAILTGVFFITRGAKR
jgi:drug/metabolite transporter (DMT)-like permease